MITKGIIPSSIRTAIRYSGVTVLEVGTINCYRYYPEVLTNMSCQKFGNNTFGLNHAHGLLGYNYFDITKLNTVKTQCFNLSIQQ